jgi:hypothetical protein
MKKSKSIQFVIDDFQDIYNTAMSTSLYEYINSSLFNDQKTELSKDALKIYNEIKNFELNNKLYNYFTVNIVSIMENYLHNILVESIEKDKEKSLRFIKEYKLERNLTSQDVIDGPQLLTLKILKNLIYHNLPKVNSIFKIIFDLDILNIQNAEIEKIFRIIKLRHGIVHKSSRIKEKEVLIKQDTFLVYLSTINNWLLNIDSLVLNGKPRKRIINYRYKFYREISNKMENKVLEIGVANVIGESMNRMFDFDNENKSQNKIMI